MLFQLNTAVTEEEYKAYLLFDSLESLRGKQNIRKARLARLFFLPVFLFSCFYFWNRSPSFALFGAAMFLYYLIQILFLKMIIKRNVNRYINNAKKEGRSLFDPFAQYEFYEEKFIESSPETRVEQNYSAIRQIHIVKERYILLYTFKSVVYVLPIPQVKAQLDEKEFVTFLSSKCANVEYY